MTTSHLFTALLLLSSTMRLPAARVEPVMDAKVRPGFADAAAKGLPATVRIVTTRLGPSSSEGAARRRESGEGSGFIFSRDGYVLTNHHVIDQATQISVQLADDRELPAQLIASDAQTDIAVLKIAATGLPTMPLGDSTKVRVGDYVLAIGNPFGVGTTVTLGIVSAMGNAGVATAEDYIQTDAAINPGNSGGPLVNVDGDLVGMNTAIISTSGGSNGVGFAIPSNLVRDVVSELVVHGKVTRGFLGVGMQPMTPTLADALGLPGSGGALIADVAPESPAALAGLAKGDVLVAMNGRVIRDVRRLRLLFATAKPGETIQLKVLHESAEKDVAVTLTELPAEAASVADVSTASNGGVLSGAEIASLNAHFRQALNLPNEMQGVILTAVDPNGESAQAGLQPGDIVQFVNRKPVRDVPELAKALSDKSTRSTLLEVRRGGSTYFFALPRY